MNYFSKTIQEKRLESHLTRAPKLLSSTGSQNSHLGQRTVCLFKMNLWDGFYFQIGNNFLSQGLWIEKFEGSTLAIGSCFSLIIFFWKGASKNWTTTIWHAIMSLHFWKAKLTCDYTFDTTLVRMVDRSL